jgi:dTDP-4-dehydrorhamnose reductase
VERFDFKVKWMVFGAEGQLGCALTRQLRKKYEQNQIFAYNHKQADITNLEQIIDLVSQHKPNQIVNAAAWTDVVGAQFYVDLVSRVNVDGAVNLAKAASHIGATLMQLSTDYVFHGGFTKPISEKEIQSPINNYGASKASAEILLKDKFKNSVVILRTAWLYGPYRKNFARTIITKALTSPDQKIMVVDDQWGQPTSTLDLADKIIEIGEKQITSGILHCTNSGATNWYEFAKLLLNAADLDSSLVQPVKTSEYATPVNRPVYSVLSHDGWTGTGLAPLRDWKLPVLELAAVIRSEVEIANGI